MGSVRVRADPDAAVVQADGQLGLLASGGGGRDRLAGGVLEQRVAAFERALGVVGGQRGRQPGEFAAARLERGGAAQRLGGPAPAPYREGPGPRAAGGRPPPRPRRRPPPPPPPPGGGPPGGR